MTSLTYHDAAGARHDRSCDRRAAGNWQVLDTGVDARARVIDTLDGRDDDRPQAEAVARDYLANRVDAQRRAGRAPGEAIPEHGGADAHSHRRPRPDRASTQRERLRCRTRLADGRVFAGDLAPERHRALQLGMLHQHTAGLVELAAGEQARRAGCRSPRADAPTTSCPAALPGRRTGSRSAARARRARTPRVGEEVFIAPAARSAPRAEKQAVSESRLLWVDVDQPGQLHRAVGVPGRAPVPPADRERRVRRLPRLLAAGRTAAGHRVSTSTGELVEPIERAHLRIIHRLGVGEDGKPNVADPACAERSRVMRLAGIGERQDGRARPDRRGRLRARAIPDQRSSSATFPTRRGRRLRRDVAATGRARDPYKRISPPEYFEKLAGIVVPRDGLVSCPAPEHDDRNPSCSVGTSPDAGLVLPLRRVAGRAGAIYDLASVLLGGPRGHALRGEAFNRARAYVADAFGEPRHQSHVREEDGR